jgi:hypothetical protein
MKRLVKMVLICRAMVQYAGRRWVFDLLVVLLGVAGLVLYLLGSGGYRDAVQAYKQDLRAKGEKLTIAELSFKPTADAQVAARHFAEAANGYSPLDEIASAAVIVPGLAPVNFTNFTASQLATYDQQKLAAAKLRNALAEPALEFPVDYLATARDNNSSLFNDLAATKQAEHMAMDIVRKALAKGDASEAALDLDAGVDIVLKCFRRPVLLGDLLREADASMASFGTLEALQSDLLSDQQWADLNERWQAADMLSNSEPSLAAEMAMGIETCDWYRKSANPFDGQIAAASSPGPPQASLFEGLKHAVSRLYNRYPKYWVWRNSWSYDEELYFLQTYEAELTAVRKARSTGTFVPALHEFDQSVSNIVEHHPAGRKHFAVLSWLGTERNYLLKLADAEAGRRLTITAIALKRYELAHNAYPASLNELVPIYLPKVPLDFMDGEPLRYKLRPDGSFLLYSVGDDGEDNGGDPTTASGNNWLRGRDIVWPRAATPKEIEDYQKAQVKKAAAGEDSN